jgi:hypothetical protein
MALGFEAPLDKVEFAAGVWCDLMSQTDPQATLSYTTWQNGQPVATSQLLLPRGCAGFFADGAGRVQVVWVP